MIEGDVAFDDLLAERVRDAFARRRDITERKMFGGLAFLCDGRMCCGIVRNDLVVRILADEMPHVIKSRHVRPMDFTGKPLKGSSTSHRLATARPRNFGPGSTEASASSRTIPNNADTPCPLYLCEATGLRTPGTRCS